MRQIKSAVTLIVLLGVIVMGTTNVSAGILMSDLTGKDNPNPCSQETKADNGIIVVGLTVIFGAGVVDSIFGKTDVPTDCGIIVTG